MKTVGGVLLFNQIQLLQNVIKLHAKAMTSKAFAILGDK